MKKNSLFILSLPTLLILFSYCSKERPTPLNELQLIATRNTKLSDAQFHDLVDNFDEARHSLNEQIILDEDSILAELVFLFPKDSSLLNEIAQKKKKDEAAVNVFVFKNELNLYALCLKLLNETIRLQYFGAADSMLSKINTGLNWAVTELNKLSTQVFLNNQVKFYRELSSSNYKNKLLLEYYRSNSFSILSSQPVKAEFFIAKGLALARALNDTKAILDFYRRIQYLVKGHYGFNALALAFGEHILRQAQENQNYYLEAVTRYYNGETFLFRGNFPKAFEQYNRALEIYSAHNHPSMVNSMKERQANVYRHLGKFELALRQYKFLLSQDASDFYKTLYLHGISLVYVEMGNFYKAEGFLKKALSLCREGQYLSNLAIFLTDLASLNLKMGDAARASQLYAEALNLPEDKVGPRSLIIIRQNLGELYLEQKDYKKAELYLQEAGTLCQKYDLGLRKAKNDFLLSRVYLSTERFDEALRMVNKSITQFDEIVDIYGKIEALTLAGALCRQKQEYELAEKSLTEAHQLSHSLPQYANEWEIDFNLARLSINRGDDSGAEKFLIQSIEHIEMLTTQLPDYEKRVSFAHKIQSPFEEMVLLQLRQKNNEAAFAYSDNSRAQVLKLLIEENKNESQVAAAGFMNLLQDEQGTLKKLQARLDEKSAVLEYEITEDELIIWCIRKNRLDVGRVALTRAVADSVLLAFKDEMDIKKVATEKRARASFKNVKPTCRFLYDVLIAPVASFITNMEMLYIIPDENLHHLPFAALMGVDSTFLLERVQLANAASAQILAQTLEESDGVFHGSEKSLLTVSVDEKGKSFKEAGKVCALFERCTNLGAKKATEKNFNQALLDLSFDNILFSSHGFLSEKPMRSYMKLYAETDTSDGRLTVADIMALKMHETDLVYLAACESAAGRVFRGEGIFSLQRAFMIAGVNTIIGNLWQVETKTTGQLAVRFFDNLKTHDKVEALRQAQLETITEFKNNYVEHPYFWAPLTLSGATR